MFLQNLVSKPYLFYGDYLFRARLFEQNRDRHFFCKDQYSANRCQKFLPKFNVDSILNVKKVFFATKFVHSKPNRFDRFEKVKIYKNKKFVFDKKNRIKHRINDSTVNNDLKGKKKLFYVQKNEYKMNKLLDLNADISDNRKQNSNFEEKLENFDSVLLEPAEKLRKINSGHSLNFKISTESINNQSKKNSFAFDHDNNDIDQIFEARISHPNSILSSKSLESIRKLSFLSTTSNEYFFHHKKPSFFERFSSEESNENFSEKFSIKTDKSDNFNSKDRDNFRDDTKLSKIFEKNSILSKKSTDQFYSERNPEKIEIVELTKVDSKSKIKAKKSNTDVEKKIELAPNWKEKIDNKIMEEKIENLKQMTDAKNLPSKPEMRESKICIIKPRLPEAIVKDQVQYSDKKKKSLAKLIKTLSSEQTENAINAHQHTANSENNILTKEEEVDTKNNSKMNDILKIDHKTKLLESNDYSKKNSKNSSEFILEKLEKKSTQEKIVKNFEPLKAINENGKISDSNKASNENDKVKIENKTKTNFVQDEPKKPNKFIQKNFSLDFDLNITRAFTFSYFTLPKQYENLNRKISIFKQNYDLIERFIKNGKNKSLSQTKDKFKTENEQIMFLEDYFKKLSAFRNKMSSIKVETETINLLNLMLEDILKNLQNCENSFVYGQFCQSESLIQNQLAVA